jgi:hypothetical protein
VLQDTGSNRPLRSAIQFESVGQTRSRAMDITVYEDPARDPDRDLQRTWDWWHTSIAGHEAQCADLVDGRRCRIGIDGITVSVGFDPANLDELTRIVAGIQLAIWPDLDSWYDLDTALPVR